MKKFVVRISIFLCIVVFIQYFLQYDLFRPSERIWSTRDQTKPLRVVVEDDQRMIEVETHAHTVDDFLKEQSIFLREGDWLVSTVPQDILYAGKKISIRRQKNVLLSVAGEKRSLKTYQIDREQLLRENDIVVGVHDRVLPQDNGTIADNATITIVRVDIQEVVLEKRIPFEKKVTEDDSISWRKTLIKQKGEHGIKKITSQVVSHDGKEISRKIIRQEIIKQPITEETLQGTKVEVGKAHTGLGTWYAHTGTLAAASPWLPMGSYVKVTNQNNGKTVIVKINDRGPFGKNRILDLDKVAFAQIASVGAGVIPLTVEEITN